MKIIEIETISEKKYPERNKDTQKSEEGDQKIEHTEIKL